MQVLGFANSAQPNLLAKDILGIRKQWDPDGFEYHPLSGDFDQTMGPDGFEYHPLSGDFDQTMGPDGFEPSTKRL